MKLGGGSGKENDSRHLPKQSLTQYSEKLKFWVRITANYETIDRDIWKAGRFERKEVEFNLAHFEFKVPKIWGIINYREKFFKCWRMLLVGMGGSREKSKEFGGGSLRGRARIH